MNRPTSRSVSLLAASAAAVCGLASAVASAEEHGPVINLAVYGDAPYGTTPTDTSEFQATPAFIESIDADPSVSLVVHVGDIHSGKQFCTQSYDLSIYNLWTEFHRPLVYTPGDNEWTDCHKSGEGCGLQHPFYNVPNFHRVVVHGSTFPLEWLKLTIGAQANAPNGPTAFGPFSWQRMTQPAP
jgi:hypothetical protein